MIGKYSLEPSDTNYEEAKVPPYTLPALSAKTRAHWEKTRRAEVMALLEDHVYGRTPDGAAEINAALLEGPTKVFDGAAIRRQVQLTLSPENRPDRSLVIEVLLYSPANSKGKSPAFVGLNFSGNQCVHPDPGIRKSLISEEARGSYRDRWPVEMLIQRGYALVTAPRLGYVRGS